VSSLSVRTTGSALAQAKTWNDGDYVSERLLSRQHRWTRRLPAFIVGLIALMGINMVGDIIFDRVQEAEQADLGSNIEQARNLQMALIDAQRSVQDFVKAGRIEYLERYLSSAKVVAGAGPSLLASLDQYASTQPGASPTLLSADLATLRSIWESAVRSTGANQGASAGATLGSAQTEELADQFLGKIAGYLEQQTAKERQSILRSDMEQEWLRVVNLTLAILAVIGMTLAFRTLMRAIGSGFAAKRHVDELFLMADRLQSATGREDTNEVLRTAAASLLPGLSGALYVFNNSRDRLDLSTRWGALCEVSADHISPTSCWALKRGKAHLNHRDEGALRCSHASHGQVALEIPMAARGQLYGLLEILAEGPDAAALLSGIEPVANAMADAMSLALSSLALREQLRNQALRDSLTGLYNRRFLEEMLERMCLDAERRKAPISAIMLDLDHFKKLNDQHGHAAGDVVLRDVAAAILSCLRSVDVACRYGGEEMAILLPDCSIEAATGKAEQIRSRISEMTRGGGAAVTASLGVASMPETTGQPADLISAADRALYEAKQQGRDRVVAARGRGAAQRLSLVEAAAAPPPAE
jgi:diguanylate cyclase (GGDEF)-like protein